MYLINAHGPDHGLSVEVYHGEVVIRQWGECCEPDENGSYSPHVQEARVSLADLLDKSGKHYDCGYVKTESQHAKIVTLAINWLAYWGGDTEYVDDSDRPCDHFGMDYGGIGAKRTEPWPSHMKCDTCGRMPE